MVKNRDNFATQFGVLMATAGSAVGLGNIWRFPFQMGINGGAAFLIVYILAVFLIGVLAMMAEFIIGREAHANAVDSFKKISPNDHWYLVGYIGIITAFFILNYYCVVAGWTLYYFYLSVTNSFIDGSPEQYSAMFDNFVVNPYIPVLFLVLVIIMTAVIISRGVRSGIEKTSKVMMPVLFILLIILAVNSCLMPNSVKGLEFMFVFNLSDLSFEGMLSAVGQAFYSLSLGMGCLITFASYFKDDVNISATATKIAVFDTLVAVFAGVVIFPALFSLGMQPDEGPGLVFKVLPCVFSQMHFGVMWAIMFYLLLFIAALTSYISMFEVVAAFILERLNISRKKTCVWVAVTSIIIGSVCSLSFGPLSDLTIMGKNIFDIFDFLVSSVFLPLGGVFISLFVGWRLDRKVIVSQLNINSPVKYKFLRAYIFFLRFIIPISVTTVFIFSFT